jgi:hypothetical protein
MSLTNEQTARIVNPERIWQVRRLCQVRHAINQASSDGHKSPQTAYGSDPALALSVFWTMRINTFSQLLTRLIQRTQMSVAPTGLVASRYPFVEEYAKELLRMTISPTLFLFMRSWIYRRTKAHAHYPLLTARPLDSATTQASHSRLRMAST